MRGRLGLSLVTGELVGSGFFPESGSADFLDYIVTKLRPSILGKYVGIRRTITNGKTRNDPVR